jgi:hypothetical protein
MAWRDTLLTLRDELAAVRAERQRRAAAEDAELQVARGELSRLADSLGIPELLSEMNATLLDNQGEIETVESWNSGQGDPDADGDEEDPAPLDDDDDDEDDDDVVTALLSWEEDGEREIAVEVLLTGDGTSVQVNGVEVRPARDALEQALLEAFRDELDL